MNFWQDLPTGFTILAPMEDVTDIVFRKVVAKAGRPDVFFTEFTNAASYCSAKGNFSTKGRLTIDQTESPIVAQIWGTNPDHFRQMSVDLAMQGFAGIDINMGCPAKDVVKIGAGSGLIGNHQLAGELIAAAASSNLPVSVKTRLGYSRIDEMADWLKFLLQQNISNLTVHLRTKKEMSKVAAHYELIPAIVDLRNQINPNIRLSINGDIRDIDHIRELAATYSGVDGYMIGRGVFQNPYCFNADNTTHTTEEKISLMRFHLDMYDKYRYIMPDEQPELIRNFNSLKHFFKIYVSGFDGAAQIREELYNCVDTASVRNVLNSYFK